MLSLYQFKPKFQACLRPIMQKLAVRGITANQITLTAIAMSLVLGGLLSLFWQTAWLFWLLPIGFLIRMVLNVLDGMLAREWMQESALGGYLNEVGDIISDAALYVPFAWILGGVHMAVFIWLASLTEILGLLGSVHGFNGRRYDGPMGKSDRALFISVLAIWYALTGSLNHWVYALVWLAILAMGLTCWQRLQNGLRASSHHTTKY